MVLEKGFIGLHRTLTFFFLRLEIICNHVVLTQPVPAFSIM